MPSYLNGPDKNGKYLPYSKQTTTGYGSSGRYTNHTKSGSNAQTFDRYTGYSGAKPERTDRSKGHSGGYRSGSSYVSSFDRKPGAPRGGYVSRPTPRYTVSDAIMGKKPPKPRWF